MVENINVKIVRINGANVPKYMTVGAVGCDVYANITEAIVLKKGGSIVIPTGIKMEIPKGYECQVRPRSGLMFKEDIVGGLGTVDNDFRGEVMIKLFNFSDSDFIINPYDRVAQFVFNKVAIASFVEVENLSDTDRGEGGFGSTQI